MKRKRTYRSAIKHLIYNLKKLQYSTTIKGKKIPIDLCICRYRLEEYIKLIDILEKKGCRVDQSGVKIQTLAHYF
jgi:hypothetical protein